MTNKEALKEIDRQEKRFAAALALSEGVFVQDVDYSVLRRCLKSDGQVLEIEKENWSRE